MLLTGALLSLSYLLLSQRAAVLHSVVHQLFADRVNWCGHVRARYKDT